MRDKNKLYVATAIILMFFLINRTIARADDNTTTQNWHDLGLYGGQITAVAVDPLNNSVLYAGSWNGDGLFKSIDAGVSWSTVPGFRNHQILAIAVDPHNPANVWIADGTHCVLSKDSGATWGVVYDGSAAGRICFSLAIDPHDENGSTVYLGTSGPNYSYSSGTLFKTGNGGTTWAAVLPFADYPVIDIVCNSSKSGEIWAVASPYFGEKNKGVQYVSTSGGLLWQKFDSGIYTDGSPYYFSSLRNIVLHPENPLAFMSGSHGVLKKTGGPSKSNGWAWTEMTKPCRALCIHPAEPDTLFAGIAGAVAKSTDTGATWQEITDSIVPFTQFISLVPVPSTHGLLYAGDINRGVFKTNDAAVTWNEINSGIRANTILATDVAGDNLSILSGSLAGLYLRDRNNAWKLLHKDIAFAVRFHPQETHTVYAGFSWQIGKSTDSGDTWTMLPTSAGSDAHGISSLALSAKKPGTLFAGIRFDAGNKGAILKISDTGDDFSKAPMHNVLVTQVPVNALAIHPDNPDVIFAGTGNFYAPTAAGDLLASSDAGSTWTELRLRDICVNSIAISAANPAVMYIACGASDMHYAGILKSTDSGKTWNRCENGLPESFSAIDIKASANDPDLAWAAIFRGYAPGEDNQSVSLSGIYVTRDGGSYWTQIGLCDYYLFTLNSLETTEPGYSRKSMKSGQTVQGSAGAGIIAGTSSGLYATSTAGTGFVTGRVICSDTSELLDGAIISSSCGNAVSAAGSYMLMLPSGMHTLNARKPGYVQAGAFSVAVSAGAATEHDIVMMQKGSDNGTDGGSCFLENLLGRNDPRLHAFRKFRDTVLQQSEEGRHIIAAYYSLGRELWPLVKKNSKIAAQAREIVALLLPYIEKAAAGNPHVPAEECIKAILDFAESLASAASPELKQMLRTEATRFLSPDWMISLVMDKGNKTRQMNHNLSQPLK